MITRILKYVIYDAVRSRIMIGYGILLFLISFGFVYIQSDPDKTVISLLNIVLLIIPLVSIILGTIHYYNSREFTELVMTQPVPRQTVFFAQYLGYSVVLAITQVMALGIPLILNGMTPAAFFLILTSVFLTFIFTALAFTASVFTMDKARGIGTSLILWFYFAILFDALVLAGLFYFSDYPLDKPMLILTALNPIDLSRIVILMNLDASALMGYTGALYQKFFGSIAGIGISMAAMSGWVFMPLWFAARRFVRKDF